MSELNVDSEDVGKLTKAQLKPTSELDELGMFDELEDGDDDIPSHIREARLNEIKMRSREQQFIQQNKSDIYKEIKEDEFLSLTTHTKKCIVHFFHADFRRCDIMHGHLLKLAVKYLDVKFAKVNVEKAKFFVNKLKIQVLPAVMCFEDGVLKHKIIGFDQMGNSDGFPTKELEKILWKLEFVQKPDNEDDEDEANECSDDENRHKKKYSSIFGGRNGKSGYDSSED